MQTTNFRVLLLLGLAGTPFVASCDDEAKAIAGLPDVSGRGPADSATGSADPDVGAPDLGGPDVAADVEVPDVEVPDAEVPDVEIPDAVPPPPVSGGPGPDGIAVITAGERTYVAWIDGTRVLLRRMATRAPNCTHEDDPQWCDGFIVLAETDPPPRRVTGTVVNEVPWIGFDGPNGRAHVIAVNLLPDEPHPLELDLSGPPLLVPGPGRLLVAGRAVGEAPDQPVAWQFVREADSAETLLPPIVDDAGLPAPDSGAGIDGGYLLRFGTAGQCVALGLNGRATGSFPCEEGQGQLISNGRVPLVTWRDPEFDELTLRAVPAFGPGSNGGPYNIGNTADPAWLAFGHDARERAAVVTGRNVDDDGNEVFRLELRFVGTDAMWYSAEPYEPERYPGVVAFTRVGETAYGIAFSDDTSPFAYRIPMRRFEFSDAANPFSFDVDEGCRPAVELCDRRDQDCDGRSDDGRCCGVARGQGYDHVLVDLGGRPQQLIVSDRGVADTNSVHLAIFNGTEWRGYAAVFEGRPTIRPWPRFEDVVLTEGKFLINAGGWNLLIGSVDRPAEPGLPARKAWKAWSYHEPVLGADPPFDEPPIVKDLPCAEVFAADVLDKDMPFEAAVIVCDNEIRRVHVQHFDRMDVHDSEDDVPIDDETIVDFADIAEITGGVVEWATMTRETGRVDNATLEVLAAFRMEDGSLRFRAWIVAAHAVLDRRLPSGMADMPADDFARPAWIRVATNTIPQVIDDHRARVLVTTGGAHHWLPVVTPGRRVKAAVAPQLEQIFIESRLDDGAGGEQSAFFAIDYADPRNLNLWSAQPAFEWDGPADFLWDAHLGEYDPALVFVEPVDGDDPDGPWIVKLRHIECLRP